jgi:hypothetical protein
MARIILLELVLFLLPFIGYAFYLYFSRIDPMKRQSWVDSPIYWMAIGGLLLMIAGFVLTATFSGAPTDASYKPAQLRDGKILPGHID